MVYRINEGVVVRKRELFMGGVILVASVLAGMAIGLWVVSNYLVEGKVPLNEPYVRQNGRLKVEQSPYVEQANPFRPGSQRELQ